MDAGLNFASGMKALMFSTLCLRRCPSKLQHVLQCISFYSCAQELTIKICSMALQSADDSSKHKRVRVDRFPVGSKLINELMAKLMEEVKQHPAVLKQKLYQVWIPSTGQLHIGSSQYAQRSMRLGLCACLERILEVDRNFERGSSCMPWHGPGLSFYMCLKAVAGLLQDLHFPVMCLQR